MIPNRHSEKCTKIIPDGHKTAGIIPIWAHAGFSAHDGRFLLTGSPALPDDIFDLIGRGLPIRNGGTGATNATSALYNLISSLSTVSSASSSYYFPLQYSSSSRKISYSNLSNAIKNSVASSLTPQDIGACRIEIGTYNGLGGHGPNGTCEITCSFPPVLMGVALLSQKGELIGNGFCVGDYCEIDVVSRWPSSYTKGYGFGQMDDPFVSGITPISYGMKSGNTVRWYNTHEDYYQLNSLDTVYYWFAIG